MLKKTTGKPSVNCIYEDGQTPLHFACISRDHKIIAILVKQKANVNAKNKLRRTPLHYVAQIEEDMFASDVVHSDEPQNLKTVKILLENGANPNIKDKDGKFPYQHAKDGKPIFVAVTAYFLYQFSV
jgi:ankyrin repeat protein